MTTALRSLTSTTRERQGRNPIPSADPSTSFFKPLDVIVLDSCHSTWIFDPGQLEYCRILKGIKVGNRPVATEWRRYWQLELDTEAESFTVYLNEARTRLIRSWRHTKNCSQCGGRQTTEPSLDEIHRSLGRNHARRRARSAIR
jgi:hypothetical protein